MRRRKPKAIVLDAWAVLAYLQGESASASLADLVAEALENAIPLRMSVVNVGEVWYILARQVSPAEADRSVAALRSWGVEFVDADWVQAYEAAVLKSKFRMSYADAFAAALTKTQKADLLTGDREFQPLDGYISIRWLKK